MSDYSPKRRTALVLAGTGSSGAYHAGAVKALDESGVKIDLVVGSGAGAVAAALSAVAGGARLHGDGGFWHDMAWNRLYRIRPAARAALILLGAAFVIFLVPAVIALLAGIAFPLVLIASVVVPDLPDSLWGLLYALPGRLGHAYVAALAVPVFVLSVVALAVGGGAYLRDRRRFLERFESFWDVEPGRRRLREVLWDVSRGQALASDLATDAEVGRRYVALASENLGQPGFRELILRTADLDTGGILPFILLGDTARRLFLGSRRTRFDGHPSAVDLRAAGYDVMFFDAMMTSLLPALTAPVHRVSFPRGGLHAGETHRLADATLLAGCGLSEALAAGAEQVILVTATPEMSVPAARRRGLWAVADAVHAGLERQAIDRDIATTQRISRMVQTVGHRTEDGRRAWQDPATGRTYREISLYVVRPERRSLGPLELDGATDPATEVLESPADLMEQGYRDAGHLFVEAVLGAPVEAHPRAEPRPQEVVEL